MKELDLRTWEREQLVNKQQLSDKHIFAAVKLLQKEFPEVTGNQCSLLSQNNGFKRQGDGSIQIHHDADRAHWLTSTMQEGKVILYDSKSTCTLSQDIENQLQAIYGEARIVEVPRIPQQRGSTDCALYAIANAWLLAQGEKPQHVVLKQNKMRDHLVDCFTSIQLRPFPHSQKRVTRTICDYHKLK